MMMDALWHAFLLAANLWGPGGLDGLGEARTEYRVEVRTESGPPILSQIPYVNRLFRNVGWSQMVAPVLPPIQAGTRCASEAPSGAEILRALPELTRIEGVYEESRDDVQMVFEKLVDQVDPPRYFPLIGPAQLHHVHWKCTVNFTETIKLSYPASFEVHRKSSEVVYIDKDHLHLCVAGTVEAEPQDLRKIPGAGRFWGVEQDNAEPQEIRPVPPPVVRPAKCTALPQVQLDIVVATINRSARPKLTYPWADKRANNMAIGDHNSIAPDANAEKMIAPYFNAIDPETATAFIRKLRAEGVLKIVAEPRVTTLSDQTASVVVGGGEVPIKMPGPTIFQPIGTRLQITPKVLADGRVHLQICTEISRVSPTNDDPAAENCFNIQSVQTTVVFRPGQTLALGGFVTQEEREIEKRITLIDNNPFIGAFWMTIRKREGINEDTVILVTPHVVAPCPCEAEEQEQPDTRVVACWENRGGSMVGSVYLFSEETKRPIVAAGRVEVQAFDMAPALKGEEPRLLAQWTFHPDMLEKLQRKDLIGVGYTLTAPWSDLPANVENIKLHTVYVPAHGASRSDEPTYVARRNEDSDPVQASQAPERPTKVVQAQAVSRELSGASDAAKPARSAVADIIRMHKAGLPKDFIIRQVALDNILTTVPADEVAKAKKTIISAGVTVLTLDDVIHLKEQGVSDDVIGHLYNSYVDSLCEIISSRLRESRR